MGGMFTLRYISEPESKYDSREVGGYYQRNMHYTFEEYCNDVYGKDGNHLRATLA